MAGMMTTLKLRLNDETLSQNEALLKDALSSAEQVILARRYPFGRDEDAEVPEEYQDLQVRIALDLINRMGAEGETSHSENGVQRTFETGGVSPSLLEEIVPKVGVPT